jgi:hypothetical protein
MVAQIEHGDRLVDAFEQAAYLAFHAGGAEATAGAEHYARFLRDGTHRAEHRGLLTP